jgi:carboxymethylenebutenolidase
MEGRKGLARSPFETARDSTDLMQTLESYDEDVRKTVDHLLSLANCNKVIGSTGMCLGGHLALRAAVRLPPPHVSPTSLPNMPPQLDTRISAAVCYFATDVHLRTLGPHTAANSSAEAPEGSNHTIDRLTELKAEVAMIFGVKDTHVSPEGRDLIRAKLREAGVVTSFYEFAWAQHAFIRDELSKGRYDPPLTRLCFEILLELFERTLKLDLGPKEGVGEVEHVC